MSAEARFAAEDKEKLERGAKNCWNKSTRILDKFIEVIFITALVTEAVCNQLFSFVGCDSACEGFKLMTLLLSLYQLFLAFIIFESWRGNITVLTYIGFMRGRASKSLFLVFTACMVAPN